MGFFKDFRDDLSDAVDEIVPGGTRKNNFSDDDMVK